jgi:hypothetical protein
MERLERVEKMTNVAMAVRVDGLKGKGEHMEVLIQEKNGWFWRGESFALAEGRDEGDEEGR